MGPWEILIVNGYVLLNAITAVRPRVGSLIQTILEAGDAGGFGAGVRIVDERGRSMLSLRTIVRAMEVLDDYTKTADFGSEAGSRELHAYYVVESAVGGEYTGGRREPILPAG